MCNICNKTVTGQCYKCYTFDVTHCIYVAPPVCEVSQWRTFATYHEAISHSLAAPNSCSPYLASRFLSGERSPLTTKQFHTVSHPPIVAPHIWGAKSIHQFIDYGFLFHDSTFGYLPQSRIVPVERINGFSTMYTITFNVLFLYLLICQFADFSHTSS